MNTISMISKNCDTFDPHRLLLNLRDKKDLKRKEHTCIYYLAFTIHGKI